MKVIVIGCGPAGLAAAHAAIGLGADVRIMAPRKKTPQRGPIFLQRPIPGISTDHPQGYIRQIVIGGSILDYHLRIYGDVNISVTGDGMLREGIHTWGVQGTYDTMWALYSPLIEDHRLNGYDIISLRPQADLIVNTAPADKFCLNPRRVGHYEAGHRFDSIPVALYFKSSYPDQPENTIIFNARDKPEWIRSSNVFGNTVTEYKPEQAPTEPDLIIFKPYYTDCNCHPRVLRVGRFGKWSTKSWIDSAYYDTRTTIHSMLHQTEWDSIK